MRKREKENFPYKLTSQIATACSESGQSQDLHWGHLNATLSRLLAQWYLEEIRLELVCPVSQAIALSDMPQCQP